MISQVVDFIILTVNLSVPIMFGALSATVAERSGVICLGVEGMMLIGALFGVLGSYLWNPWGGVVLAIVSGIMVGFVYGFFGVVLKGQQTVVGLAVNIFAGGITPMICSMVWDSAGASTTVDIVPLFTVPILSRIPIIGAFFCDISPFVVMLVITVVVLQVFFFKTKYGLRLRAIGDFPLAVQTQGIDTNRYKMIAMMCSGILAALGGAYLSISYSNVFVMDMVAGRGFMGVAANIFGGWKPTGSMVASLFFAVVHSLRYYLIEFEIPTHFVQMIPYVVTLLALVIFGRNSKSPEGLGSVVD